MTYLVTYNGFMPRQSSAKQQMITAARRLFRERGYLGTSFADVLAESGAPRGSVYFHFPEGKEELAAEVAIAHAAESVAVINRLTDREPSASALLRAFVAHFRDEIVSSGYREGCAVAPIVLEVAGTTPRLAAVTRRGFQDMITTLSARLVDKGLESDRARELATLAVTGMEGALVLSRALQDPEPFEALAVRLAEAAESDPTFSA
ncbi:TetR/AcrR family transcriptional regulator [Streptomyces sp. NPDC004393]